MARSFVRVTSGLYLVDLSAWRSRDAVQAYLPNHPQGRHAARGQVVVVNLTAHPELVAELVGSGRARAAHVVHTCARGWCQDPPGELTAAELAMVRGTTAPPMVWPAQESEWTGSRCRSCQAPVVWVRTRLGRKMPCNPELVAIAPRQSGPYAVVTADGRVERGELVDGGVPKGAAPPGQVFGRLSHFSTCPHAGEHRR